VVSATPYVSLQYTHGRQPTLQPCGLSPIARGQVLERRIVDEPIKLIIVFDTILK
jgi:hypothetical protein